MTTPYAGKIGLVFHGNEWRSDGPGHDRNLEALARRIVHQAPNVKAVIVRTSTGGTWQGQLDGDDSNLAIRGPDDIRRWAQTLEAHGLEFHAWAAPLGVDVNADANRVRECCNTPGVRSLLLAVEEAPDYFPGGGASVRDLLQKIRAGVPPDFHLGLGFHAHGQHLKHIHIHEWLPYVNSLHPMIDQEAVGHPVESALQAALRVCATFRLPVVPMLQAGERADPAELARGAQLSLDDYGVNGVTYNHLGALGAPEFAVIRSVRLPELGPERTGIPALDADPNPHAGGAVIVRPGDRGYSDGTYRELTPAGVWQTFSDVHGWTVKYKPSASQQEVFASYQPILPRPDRYVVEVFVPHTNADLRATLYFVVYYRAGQRVEQKVALDQSIHYNTWAPLGVFELDPAQPEAGRVNQVDYSIEIPPRMVAFSAIRWRVPSAGEIVVLPAPADAPQQADGCDPPVGTAEERHGRKVWPGEWQDANGYGRWYGDSAGNGAFHTGADLNLNKPRWNLDRGMPVYAVASGTVTWAGRRGNFWRNVIVIQHDPLPDGVLVCTRYGHVENMRVAPGDRVRRGQQIAVVGMSGGAGGNYHLHFDVSPTRVLLQDPGHWPGRDKGAVLKHYVDPRKFIEDQRPA